MWVHLGLVVLATTLASARTAVLSAHQNVDDNVVDSGAARKASASASASGLLSDVRYLYRVYEECKNDDLTTCLKMKVVTSLDSAVRSVRSIPIFEGVSLVNDNDPAINAVPPVTESQLQASLPRALEQREDTLDTLIFDKVMQVFRSHSLRFKLLDDSSYARSLGWEAEGARKRKGLNSLLLLAMLMGGTMIPLKFGALALLAGKALIVSKLALALALIIGLKKLVSSSGGHETSYQVVTVPAHGHAGSHYKRSIHEMTEANDMAYNHYDPTLQQQH